MKDNDKNQEMKNKTEDLIVRMKELYGELIDADDGSIEYQDMKDVIVNGIGGIIYANTPRNT